MVESLKELNRICQKPRYKEVGNWMVRHILRDAALPITWVLLHTRVTANQVTAVSLGIALLGNIFFAFPSPYFFLGGTLLLQLWYLLDHVDGQIARYRKTASLTGHFFDYIMHHTVHGTLFFCLGYYAFARSGALIFLILGFTASLSIMLFNMLSDTKHKAFYQRLSGMTIVRIHSDPAVKPASPRNQPSSGKKIFSLIHKSIEIHVLINLLTLTALLQMFPAFSGIDFRFLLFGFYSLAAPFLVITKVTYLVTSRKIDSEFEAIYQAQEPQP